METYPYCDTAKILETPLLTGTVAKPVESFRPDKYINSSTCEQTLATNNL
jgi:hypothetical protein